MTNQRTDNYVGEKIDNTYFKLLPVPSEIPSEIQFQSHSSASHYVTPVTHKTKGDALLD